MLRFWNKIMVITKITDGQANKRRRRKKGVLNWRLMVETNLSKFPIPTSILHWVGGRCHSKSLAVRLGIFCCLMCFFYLVIILKYRGLASVTWLLIFSVISRLTCWRAFRTLLFTTVAKLRADIRNFINIFF